MDENNYQSLLATIKQLNYPDKIKCFHCGVWNKNSIISYGKENFGQTASYSIYKKDNLKKTEMVKLDDILYGKRITLIKMDIEGAELNALKGTENIIKAQKPNLAICLYHKLNDFWEIPLFIKTLVPEYHLYVKHHSSTFWGTVLYAAI
jgi:FkbM family methyltransferase